MFNLFRGGTPDAAATLAQSTSAPRLVEWALKISREPETVSPLDATLSLPSTSGTAGPLSSSVFISTDRSVRGLFAARRIPSGSPLFELPAAHFLITGERALMESSFRFPDDEEVPTWYALMLFLIEARYGSNQDLKQQWAPYIDSLPNETGGLLEWSAAEVDLFRSCTVDLRTVDQILAGFDDAANDLLPLLDRAIAANLLPNDVTSFDPATALRWAFSILLSRCIRLNALNDLEVLVPFADLANHSTLVSNYIDYDAPSRRIVARADREYKEKEQVFVSYGPKSNAQLLMSYGFIPHGELELDGNVERNPFDSVPVTLALELPPESRGDAPTSSSDPLLPIKWAALEAARRPYMQSFPVLMNAMPRGMLGFAALVAARPRDEKEAQSFLENDTTLSPLTKLLALEYLLTQAQFYMKQSKVSMEQAKREWEEACTTLARQAGTSSPLNTKSSPSYISPERRAAMMAIRYREQQILARFENNLRTEIRKAKRPR